MMLKEVKAEASVMEDFLWDGEPLSEHGSQAFYKAFVTKNKVYRLGDVVYVRHMEDFERMSFLEIYMLWELRGVKYLSVRAYYFPEDTVEGRFPEQGQDEVLCLEGEVVMSCREFIKHVTNTYPESKDLPEPKILSFPGYCRCCAMRRRLGEHLSEYTTHPLFRALGGVDPRYRVLFCRDTVHDRELNKLWKCQNYYREVPSSKHNTSKKRMKIHSESNDDSSISDAGEILNKANGKGRGRSLLPHTKSKCNRAGEAKINNVKDSGTRKIAIIEEDCEVDVEDTKIHSVISSASFLPDNPPQSTPHTTPHQPTVTNGTSTGHANLLTNVTNIKLPNNCLSTQTTPQQLDIIVRQLSHELTKLQEAKNTQRKLKYLMKQ